MINLIPPEYKQELLKEKQFKIAMILVMIAISFLVSLVIILFSIQVYTDSQLAAEKDFLENSQKEMEFSKIEQLEYEVTSTNKEVSQLNTFYAQQVSIAEILEEISQVLPQGIYLNSVTLNLSVEKDYCFSLLLNGFSPDRQSLLDLEKNLGNDSFFKDFSFPPSTWTKSENIEFSLILKI